MKHNIEIEHKKLGRWILASVTNITTPKPGRVCYGPLWWAVTENDEVVFFDNYRSPQCNINKAVVASLCHGFDAPVTKPRFIEMAFIPHRCTD